MVRLQDLHLVAVPANSLTELLASPRAGAAPGVNGEYQKGSSETAPAPLPTGARTTGPLEPALSLPTGAPASVFRHNVRGFKRLSPLGRDHEACSLAPRPSQCSPCPGIPQ